MRNNKGFAVSTLIYGLSILGFILITIVMSTMSNTRINSKKMSKDIENELINYSNSTITYSASNDVQQFVTPEGESGWYRVELWGAQGGSNGGRGAYTTGIIYLDEGDNLFFYVGKQGTSSTGGEETSVRLLASNGSAEEKSSIESRIMVAGGGGVNKSAVGSTTKHYQKNISTKFINENNKYYKLNTNSNITGTTYSNVKNVPSVQAYDYNSSNNKTSAGKGFYNGVDESEGGTSYISGYKTSTYTKTNSDGSSSKIFFYDGLMLAGVRSGDGLAKIEKVMSETDEISQLPRQNNKLNGVSKVNFCIDDQDDQNILDNAKLNIVYNNGTSETLTKTTTINKCNTYNLKQSLDLDELTIFIDNSCKDTDECSIYSNTLKGYTLSVNGNNILIKNTDNNGKKYSRSLTPDGIHISAYQPDYTTSILPGTYYIFPVTSNTNVLSTYKNQEEKDSQVSSSELNGEKNEKWTIKKIDCKLYSSGSCPTEIENLEYRIENAANYNALSINGDENKPRNKIKANSPFNDISRNSPQIWKISPTNDSSFTITSSASQVGSPGGLVVISNGLIISDSDSFDLARFYFYKLDFTSN